MADIVTCPNCEKKLKIPETLQGKSVKCPGCGETFLPGGSRAPAPPPAPPPEERRSDRVSSRPSGRSLEPVSKRGRDEDLDDLDDDEDLDDRPSRRKRSRRGGGHLEPHRGQTIMVLGILSLFVAGIILGPIAWVMGNNDLKKIREGRMDPEGESSTSTGRTCGMIGTILNIVLLAIGLGVPLIMFLFVGGCCCLGSIGGAAAPPPGPGNGF